MHGKSTREVKLKDESFLGTQVACVHPTNSRHFYQSTGDSLRGCHCSYPLTQLSVAEKTMNDPYFPL